jgi:hypothetical protein
MSVLADLPFHQECFGIDHIPKGKWFCSTSCKHGRRIDRVEHLAAHRIRFQRRRRMLSNHHNPKETAMLKEFWGSVEPYFDERFLTTHGDELLQRTVITPNQVTLPPLGRHYQLVWNDEDELTRANTARAGRSQARNVVDGTASTPAASPASSAATSVAASPTGDDAAPSTDAVWESPTDISALDADIFASEGISRLRSLLTRDPSPPSGDALASMESIAARPHTAGISVMATVKSTAPPPRDPVVIPGAPYDADAKQPFDRSAYFFPSTLQHDTWTPIMRQDKEVVQISLEAAAEEMIQAATPAQARFLTGTDTKRAKPKSSPSPLSDTTPAVPTTARSSAAKPAKPSKVEVKAEVKSSIPTVKKESSASDTTPSASPSSSHKKGAAKLKSSPSPATGLSSDVDMDTDITPAPSPSPAPSPTPKGSPLAAGSKAKEKTTAVAASTVSTPGKDSTIASLGSPRATGSRPSPPTASPSTSIEASPAPSPSPSPSSADVSVTSLSSASPAHSPRTSPLSSALPSPISIKDEPIDVNMETIPPRERSSSSPTTKGGKKPRTNASAAGVSAATTGIEQIELSRGISGPAAARSAVAGKAPRVAGNVGATGGKAPRAKGKGDKSRRDKKKEKRRGSDEDSSSSSDDEDGSSEEDMTLSEEEDMREEEEDAAMEVDAPNVQDGQVVHGAGKTPHSGGLGLGGSSAGKHPAGKQPRGAGVTSDRVFSVRNTRDEAEEEEKWQPPEVEENITQLPTPFFAMRSVDIEGWRNTGIRLPRPRFVKMQHQFVIDNFPFVGVINPALLAASVHYSQPPLLYNSTTLQLLEMNMQLRGGEDDRAADDGGTAAMQLDEGSTSKDALESLASINLKLAALQAELDVVSVAPQEQLVNILPPVPQSAEEIAADVASTVAAEAARIAADAAAKSKQGLYGNKFTSTAASRRNRAAKAEESKNNSESIVELDTANGLSASPPAAASLSLSLPLNPTADQLSSLSIAPAFDDEVSAELWLVQRQSLSQVNHTNYVRSYLEMRAHASGSWKASLSQIEQKEQQDRDTNTLWEESFLLKAARQQRESRRAKFALSEAGQINKLKKMEVSRKLRVACHTVSVHQCDSDPIPSVVQMLCFYHYSVPSSVITVRYSV